MLQLSQVPEDNRKNVAFQLVVAMRDAVNIARKKVSKPTYENAIRLFHDFSPELYDELVSNLPQRNLSDDAKLIIAQAEAMSKELGKKIEPLEVLRQEIEKFRKLFGQIPNADFEKKKILKNKIGSLESIRKSLLPRKITENRILIRDTTRANREDYGAKLFRESDFFIDYELSDRKYLRIRLLHPDKSEHITGADLIYEQHDEERGLIRVAFLQYKIWENGILNISQVKNLEKQLSKLQNCLCGSGLCEKPEGLDKEIDFRFPYCSAFLRPTDKLQDQNERLVSSGIHIPVCAIENIKNQHENKLIKKRLKYSSINQDIFEYLFNRELIGSQWINEDRLEEFYKSNKILEKDDTIVFYAREIKEKAPDSDYTETDI